jgi:hypothetical protein
MITLRRIIGAMLVLSIAACFDVAVQAADSTPPGAVLPGLKLVPNDALAVVIINHLNQADEQVRKLAGEMQIPVPGLLSLLKMQAGIHEGVDDSGSAILALMPGAMEGSAPIGVKFVPVTDYQKFVGQFKPADAAAEIVEADIGTQASVIAHKGDFAVIAANADRDTLEKVLRSTKSIGAVFGSLDAWIGGQTMSFVATPTGVKRGISEARKGVGQMKAVLANSNDASVKMAAGNLEMYERLFEAADKELSVFAVGLHVDNDGGLHIDSRAEFVAGGSWAAEAGNLAAPAGARLACLPGGPFMIAFDGAMPKSFSKNMMNMSVDMINNMIKAGGGKELNEEQSKQLDGLMEKSMAGLRSMSMVMGPPRPGESMYSNMAGVMKVKDARQYMSDYQAAMEKMRDIFAATAAEMPFAQDIKRTKVDGVDGLEFTMDMSGMFKNMPNNNPAATKMMQTMVGAGGKLSVFIVPIDDTTVAISYVNTDNIARIKAACQNPQASLASDADIAQTAKLLPPGAQWVGYLSPKGFVGFVSTFMSAAAPAGGGLTLPEFPQTPPVGFAAEQSSKGLDLQIVVPGAALKGIGTYVKQMSGPKAAPPQVERMPPIIERKLQ